MDAFRSTRERPAPAGSLAAQRGSSRYGYVFVVGCNRSGTSLVRQVLNAAEGISLSPETHYLRRFASSGRRHILRHFEPLADAEQLVRFADFVYAPETRLGMAYWQWLRRNVPQSRFAEALLAAERTERGLFAALLELYASETAPSLRHTLGEKTPTHIYYVPRLLEWFPDARVVHVFRDLRAVVASKQHKLSKAGAREASRRLPAVTGPAELLNTVRAWFDAARLHEHYRARYGDRYLLVRFEDLVQDPETVVPALCDFVGVPFASSMLGDIDVVASGFAAADRGSRGFDAAAIDRWREHLHPIAAATLSRVARTQLRRFGYAP